MCRYVYACLHTCRYCISTCVGMHAKARRWGQVFLLLSTLYIAVGPLADLARLTSHFFLKFPVSASQHTGIPGGSLHARFLFGLWSPELWSMRGKPFSYWAVSPSDRKIFLIKSYESLLLCCARVWAQGFPHTSQVLYHRSTPPAWVHL